MWKFDGMGLVFTLLFLGFIWGITLMIYLQSRSFWINLDHRKSKKPRYRWEIALILTIVVFGGGNILTTSFSPQGDAVRSVTAVDLASHFGLTSGKSYPLVLGERVSGAGGQATAEKFGLFYARMSVDLKPASSISVGFQHGKDYYILELPVDSIKFRDGTTQSVTLLIKNVETTDNPDVDWGQNERIVTKRSACQWTVYTAWHMCDQKLLTSHFKSLPEFENGGLGKVVSNFLAGAIITVPHDTYTQLLGAHS